MSGLLGDMLETMKSVMTGAEPMRWREMGCKAEEAGLRQIEEGLDIMLRSLDFLCSAQEKPTKGFNQGQSAI